MATLEAEIGVKLLVRSPQGVTPTQAGLHFYRAAHAIVRRYDDAIREAAAIGGQNAGRCRSASQPACWVSSECRSSDCSSRAFRTFG
jgi:DNA-binding transcriptional LysR family regulator